MIINENFYNRLKENKAKNLYNRLLSPYGFNLLNETTLAPLEKQADDVIKAIKVIFSGTSSSEIKPLEKAIEELKSSLKINDKLVVDEALAAALKKSSRLKTAYNTLKKNLTTISSKSAGYTEKELEDLLDAEKAKFAKKVQEEITAQSGGKVNPQKPSSAPQGSTGKPSPEPGSPEFEGPVKPKEGEPEAKVTPKAPATASVINDSEISKKVSAALNTTIKPENPVDIDEIIDQVTKAVLQEFAALKQAAPENSEEGFSSLQVVNEFSRKFFKNVAKKITKKKSVESFTEALFNFYAGKVGVRLLTRPLFNKQKGFAENLIVYIVLLFIDKQIQGTEPTRITLNNKTYELSPQSASSLFGVIRWVLTPQFVVSEKILGKIGDVGTTIFSWFLGYIGKQVETKNSAPLIQAANTGNLGSDSTNLPSASTPTEVKPVAKDSEIAFRVGDKVTLDKGQRSADGTINTEGSSGWTITKIDNKFVYVVKGKIQGKIKLENAKTRITK